MKFNDPSCYPKTGIAHGLYAHEDNRALLSVVETVHPPDNDHGVIWTSLSETCTSAPILSQRDKKDPTLAHFVAPPGWAS